MKRKHNASAKIVTKESSTMSSIVMDLERQHVERGCSNGVAEPLLLITADGSFIQLRFRSVHLFEMLRINRVRVLET